MGVTSDSGADSTFGTSGTGETLSGCGFTSTTDIVLSVGAVSGSAFGCTMPELSETGPLLPTSLSDGVWVTFCFGFFGVTDAGDESEPDFFFSTSVDFLLVLPPSASLASTGAAASSPPSSASSSPDEPEGGEDSVKLDADGDEVDPGDEPEEEDEVFSEDVSAEDVLEESVSDGPAHATPGVVATATPTPKATAKPPTRPTYLA